MLGKLGAEIENPPFSAAMFDRRLKRPVFEVLSSVLLVFVALHRVAASSGRASTNERRSEHRRERNTW